MTKSPSVFFRAEPRDVAWLDERAAPSSRGITAKRAIRRYADVLDCARHELEALLDERELEALTYCVKGLPGLAPGAALAHIEVELLKRAAPVWGITPARAETILKALAPRHAAYLLDLADRRFRTPA